MDLSLFILLEVFGNYLITYSFGRTQTMEDTFKHVLHLN